MSVRIITGDCREQMAAEGPFDLIIADPPYGDTSLDWDRKVSGWAPIALSCLKPTGSIWIFGSMRYWLAASVGPGWSFAQDIVWEKHNGSGFAADRFKRVHEHALQFYPTASAWAEVYNDVQTTLDATARTCRRKGRPPHMGNIDGSIYASIDGGPRLMRSVIYLPSMHGRAIHPTEKPSALMEILVRTSCPEGGLVGDFFAGSGSVGEACAMAGRGYVGCEIDSQMADKARDRLAGHLFAEVAAE